MLIFTTKLRKILTSFLEPRKKDYSILLHWGMEHMYLLFTFFEANFRLFYTSCRRDSVFIGHESDTCAMAEQSEDVDNGSDDQVDRDWN